MPQITAGRLWTTNANGITYLEGNVGVGVATPTEILHIDGNIRIASDPSTLRADGTFSILRGTDARFKFQSTVTDLNSPSSATQLRLFSTYAHFPAGNVGIGTVPEVKLDVAGAIAITDGMTAPGTLTGKASIYIDSADGDLKIKFADGTVKTITTDT